MQARKLTGLIVAGLLTAASVVIASPASANGNCATYFLGRGTGTAGDPYLVSAQLDLDEVQFCLDKAFRQTADIALTGTWTPIGSGGSPFTGTYDGNGFSITNLSVSLAADYAGLFGETNGATLTGITVSGSVVGQRYVGGLVGWASSSTVVNCRASVSVLSDNFLNRTEGVGGLIGYLTGGSVRSSSASGSVSRAYSNGNRVRNIGGLVGYSDGVVSSSFATGAVTGTTSVGGLIGYQNGAAVQRSYASGNVAGDAAVGGLFGQLSTVGSGLNLVENVYARGAATAGSTSVGSLIGSVTGAGGTRGLAYGTGAVSGGAGGFIGDSNAAWVGAFWDVMTTGKSSATNAGALSGVSGKTTTELTDIATFQAANWSISTRWAASGTTWGICPTVNDGYPYLQSLYAADPCGNAPEDPASYPTAAMQAFAVPAGTAPADCAALAPASVDWPALRGLRAKGWAVTYDAWPNDGRGGWVCWRQPVYTATGWGIA